MIIMLLNRRMSNKVIKRYALQTAMIVDLLALTGSYVMGSCRKTKNSIYISLLLFFVLAYVGIHVLIAIHVIPEGCKQHVAGRLELLFGHNQRGDANVKKDWERRRNILLMLAILAATVTYQAGMNPPGGVWSDDKAVSGEPGDPILQHNNLKRYDVFYYSNSVSFVSSVVITILLVNKESCEHGIKSYALRVCLVVGLIGLLIAYSAGSCRKAKESIYLIIIAVAVLISLVIQVRLLSSTHDTLGGTFGNCIECLLERLFGKSEVGRRNTSQEPKSSGHQKKKDQKRHKYLMLLAILAASITYQAGLNPPGGFWSDDGEDLVEGEPILNPPGGFWSDNKGHLAGNPVLLDINPRRYEIFFVFNSISFMASIVVIMFLLNNSVREKNVPLDVLHLIMILDLLALMTAFAAGSCRKFRTSVYVYALVVGVLIYLVIVIFLSSGIAKCLRPGKRIGVSSLTHPNGASGTELLIHEQQV
uniref:PGG domain-containing protein n=1 Tax=Arundo donax TaxID=35708 RepID=A0A0A8XPQ8_ARUDO